MAYGIKYKGYSKSEMPTDLKIKFVEEYLEKYLKNDGVKSDISDLKRTVKLIDGREIQFANWITSDYRTMDEVADDEEVSGWYDEIVFVGRELTEDKKVLLGMDYKRDLNVKEYLFDALSEETFEQVMFAVMMHRASSF